MSKKQSGTHLVNLALNNRKMKSQVSGLPSPDIPEIQAVEVMSDEGTWSIGKRDDYGKYFSLMNTEGQTII